MTTWTPATQQSETWLPAGTTLVHVFDPNVFAPAPVFDVNTQGLWNDRTPPSSTWTAE